MAGTAILKHMHNLPDAVRALVGNPYDQLFCGEEFFQHRLRFGAQKIF
jgi:transposase, IS5 family